MFCLNGTRGVVFLSFIIFVQEVLSGAKELSPANKTIALVRSLGHRFTKPRALLSVRGTELGTPLPALKTAHLELPVYLYPAGHGFNCDQRSSYHAESARLARERAQAFLREHIG